MSVFDFFRYRKKPEVTKNNFKTIIDYGAVVYNSRLEAINGKDSSKAIQDMVDDVRVAVLPPCGWIKNEKSTVLYRSGESVVSLGQGNRSVNLISTKPIDMFLPVYRNHDIKGFTAWYIGKKITKECAVVRYGGVPLPHGAIYEWYNIDHTVREQKTWHQRTQCISNDLDFDFEGDDNYIKSRETSSPYNYNKTFIENSGAHGVWIDYSANIEHAASYFHFTKIRGNWRNINTGLKITKKDASSQSLNTLDFKVSIWGFRQVCNIQSGNLFKIKILGQHQYMLNWNPDNFEDENMEEYKIPAFEINGAMMHCDIFNYDRGSGKKSGTNKIRGQYDVNKLDTQGLNNLGSWAGDNIRHIDADFSKSTIINHSVVDSLTRLSDEAIEDLKKQLK